MTMEALGSDTIVLKILSGVQSGVEVALRDGEYMIGSGLDDDIQLIDISLKPGHLKIKVSAGRVEIKGGFGEVLSAHGLSIGPLDDEWQELEPLDVLTAGSSRFALGPLTAQWATIMEDQKPREDVKEKSQKPPIQETSSSLFQRGLEGITRLYHRFFHRWRSFFLPIGGGIFVFFLALFWIFTGSPVVENNIKKHKTDLEVVRELLKPFPFAKDIDLKQDVDGTLFATGYVENLAQRRAIVSAVEENRSPVRMRLYVLETLRQEIDEIMGQYGQGSRYTLSPRGELVLSGVILDTVRTEKLVSLLKEGVVGLKSLTSQIKTAPLLLQDVEALARNAQIHETVLFRLEGDTIEASGVIPSSKVDSWVGFLQAYARRFADHIGLRSYVQLVTDASIIVGRAASPPPPAPEKAIVLAARKPVEGVNKTSEINLDVDRLKRGTYDVKDIFAPSSSSSSSLAASQKQQDSGADIRALVTPKKPAPIPAETVRFSDIAKRFSKEGEMKSATPAIPSSEPSRIPQNRGVSEKDPGVQKDPSVNTPNPDLKRSPALEFSRLEKPMATETGRSSTLDAHNSQADSASPLSALDQGIRDLMGLVDGEDTHDSRGQKEKISETSSVKEKGQEGEASSSPSEKLQKGLAVSTETSSQRLGKTATGLVQDWAQGLRQSTSADTVSKNLNTALDSLASVWQQGEELAFNLSESEKRKQRQVLKNKLLPLFNHAPQRFSRGLACWSGSQLTQENLATVLFWLDLLSVSDAMSLSSFDPNDQNLILEAALSPKQTQQCAISVRDNSGKPVVQRSLYLQEIQKNPDFVRFLIRDVQAAPLEISGVNLGASRFLQTKTGQKLKEGSAPDGATRISYIGELGVSIQTRDGFSALIYAPDLAWITTGSGP